jgi:hypothetical protein
MFDRGINNTNFLDALKAWLPKSGIVGDRDLFIAMRKRTVNVYYQGCSLFEISYSGEIQLKTHFKYLIRPRLPSGKSYVTWKNDRPNLGNAADFFIDSFDIDALKRASWRYAEDEKVGIHNIIKCNTNVIDVEITLPQDGKAPEVTEDGNGKSRRTADRIDFAAIQERDGTPFIVFFEAKRFENKELRAKDRKPLVLEQIKGYEDYINKHLSEFKDSYQVVCKNLVALNAGRGNDLVRRVAQNPEQLRVDPAVRLVVFDFDEDQRDDKVWADHRQVLLDYLGEERLLLRGRTNTFTYGISKY